MLLNDLSKPKEKGPNNRKQEKVSEFDNTRTLQSQKPPSLLFLCNETKPQNPSAWSVVFAAFWLIIRIHKNSTERGKIRNQWGIGNFYSVVKTSFLSSIQLHHYHLPTYRGRVTRLHGYFFFITLPPSHFFFFFFIPNTT